MAHQREAVAVVPAASRQGSWSLLSLSNHMLIVAVLLLVQAPQPLHAFYVSYEDVPAYAVGERYVLYFIELLVHYSTVQYSTVQYSTVQLST
jgi:hypothetical protein